MLRTRWLGDGRIKAYVSSAPTREDVLTLISFSRSRIEGNIPHKPGSHGQGGSTSGGRDELRQQATAAMAEMSKEDPGLDELTRKGPMPMLSSPRLPRVAWSSAAAMAAASYTSRLDFVADASAVILKTGAAANARFVNGVAVFVRPIGGAMAEASVGGQQVTYVPK